MTQKKTYRIHQINRQLKEEIASVMLMELQNDILHDVTVTEVRTSKDLHHAVVFYTVHTDSDLNVIANAVQHSAGRIRSVLYGRLHLKHIPELDFRYDDTLDRAERIFRTLDEIRDGDPSIEDGVQS